MKITDYNHFENEVKLTLENTEVLYTTALHMDALDLQSMKQLTEEVVVTMQDNGAEFDFKAVANSGVKINNFIVATDCAFPVVVDTVKTIKAK